MDWPVVKALESLLAALIVLAAAGAEEPDDVVGPPEPGSAVKAEVEQVALRTAGGRFVRTRADGTLAAERTFPTEDETFSLVPRDKDRFLLRDAKGRYLLAVGLEDQKLWAANVPGEPGIWGVYTLTEAAGNRTAFRSAGGGRFLSFPAAPPGKNEPPPVKKDPPPGGPKPEESVELFQVAQTPTEMKSLFSRTITDLADHELTGKEYDKVRAHKVQRYVDLPKLLDPGKMKRHRVLSMEQQYRIRAGLDGKPQIEILRLAHLQEHFHRQPGRLLFVARAVLPLRGRVSYAIPDRLGVGTGYRATVHLTLVGQTNVGKPDDKESSPVELLEFEVQLRGLELSNDLLNLGRGPIEDLINHELRENDDRLRRQANQSLRKALQSDKFRPPMLKYLGFL